MSAHVARLEKMAELTRSRRNMEKVKAALEELEELKGQLSPYLETASDIRDALATIVEKFDEVDPDFLPDGAHDSFADAAEKFGLFVPAYDDELAQFEESYDTVIEGIDELETMLDDRDYGADARDEQWYQVLEYVGQLANALRQLDRIGIPLKVDDDAD